MNGPVRRDRAFTLIELLVVIAIIAILASLLFPVILAAKAKANQSMCASNMREITIALLNYADDWANVLPGLNAFGDFVDQNPTGVYRGPLWKYVKSKRLFACPAARIRHRDPTGKEIIFNFTYSMNGYMTIAPKDRPGADKCGESLSKSINHTRTILLVDENCEETRNDEEIMVNDALFIWKDRTADRHPGGAPHSLNVNGRIIAVNGVANVSYVDSHIGTVPGLVKWNDPDGQALFCH